MPSDRSLDEFVGADDGESEDTDDSSVPPTEDPTGDDNISDDDTTGDNTTGDDTPDDDTTSDVEPATPTAAWAPEDTCDRCGDPTHRSWYEDGTLVCASCKEW